MKKIKSDVSIHGLKNSGLDGGVARKPSGAILCPGATFLLPILLTFHVINIKNGGVIKKESLAELLNERI